MTLPSHNSNAQFTPAALGAYMQDLEDEIRTAIQAIRERRLENLEHSVARQSVLCVALQQELSHLAPHAQKGLTAQIQQAHQSLSSVSAGYSLLLEQAQASGNLLLAVQSSASLPREITIQLQNGCSCSVEA